MARFNKKAFDTAFDAAIIALTEAEKITKATLRDLSRSVLEAHHVTEDVMYINKVVAALSPVNKKVAILFFTEFSGFRVDNGIFTKKDKALYEKAHAAYVAFMEDPNNNIWTWAEREVDIEAKAFDAEQIKKMMARILKKAADSDMGQADVLRAMFSCGIEVDALMTVVNEIANKPAPVLPGVEALVQE